METNETHELVLEPRYRLKNPLVILMEDGVTLRIDTAVIEDEYREELASQIGMGGDVEMKFVIPDDQEINGDENTEQWELVYFPRFDANDDEINHSTVVDFPDSLENGNFNYVDGKVYTPTSNWVDPDYLKYQKQIAQFAAEAFEEIIQGD
jgi:hypothetical protein